MNHLHESLINQIIDVVFVTIHKSGKNFGIFQYPLLDLTLFLLSFTVYLNLTIFGSFSVVNNFIH